MTLRTLTGALAAAAVATSAHAHHAMDNATPSTLFQGLVSGLAHPVIGLDHLLFVLALGAACYVFGRGVGTIAACVAGTLVGTAAHLHEATLPFAEAWVALSLLVLGALVYRGGASLRGAAAPLIVAVLGTAHGYAYGEAIVGAETTPLVAYLAGFAIVQLALALAAFAGARAFARAKPAFATRTALAGVLSVAGSTFLVLALA